jgi:Protein of unknown function (DUF2815)
MADTNAEGSRFAFLVPVRLYGPVVIAPKPIMINGKAKGDPEYGTKFFFPLYHPEAKAFSETLARVKTGKFGKDAKGVAYPFQMGDAWADKWTKKNPGKATNPRDFARGMVLARASSKNFPPMLSYLNGHDIIDIPDEARAASGGKFYSGVEALVEINLVPYDGNGDNIPDCVKAYLTKVCSLGRGDRIGGASSAQTFAGFARNIGSVSDEDPTGDLDDEIPF